MGSTGRICIPLRSGVRPRRVSTAEKSVPGRNGLGRGRQGEYRSPARLRGRAKKNKTQEC